MKVLFCAYDRPGHIATGPNAWIQRLIPDLLSRNLNVMVHFFYEGNIELCPTISYFENNGLPYVASSLKKHVYVEEQTLELLKVVKKHSVTVLVANLVIPAFYTAQYLKDFNIPVIIVLHSNEPHTKGVIDKFFVDNVSENLYSVSVSKLINSYIPKLADKHLVISCGTPLYDGNKAMYNGKMKVIYAGRIEIEQKQILLLTKAFIDASYLLTEIEFNIYGNGRYENQVIANIEEHSNVNVNFKGPVAASQIQEVMAQHHIFTLMSDYEGMPVALMEAMACGLVPVCLHEDSGVNEIIIDGYNGFIVKDRYADYQSKLKILQTNPELWQQMSNNAVKTIREKYSADVTHEKWAEFLSSFNANVTLPVIIPKKINIYGAPFCIVILENLHFQIY